MEIDGEAYWGKGPGINQSKTISVSFSILDMRDGKIGELLRLSSLDKELGIKLVIVDGLRANAYIGVLASISCSKVLTKSTQSLIVW